MLTHANSSTRRESCCPEETRVSHRRAGRRWRSTIDSATFAASIHRKTKVRHTAKTGTFSRRLHTTHFAQSRSRRLPRVLANRSSVVTKTRNAFFFPREKFEAAGNSTQSYYANYRGSKAPEGPALPSRSRKQLTIWIVKRKTSFLESLLFIAVSV